VEQQLAAQTFWAAFSMPPASGMNNKNLFLFDGALILRMLVVWVRAMGISVSGFNQPS
jgi:hypothetical protein